MNTKYNELPVAVLGAGPVGMAAAAHLVQQGFNLVVLEAGATVGANLDTFRHVRLFSPWRYNIDPAARGLLEASGWEAPDLEGLPTADEIIERYLRPLAGLSQIASGIMLQHRVIQVTRQGQDKLKTAGRDRLPFLIRVSTPDGEREILAQAVLDATGTWNQANPLGASGIPAIGEGDLQSQITYGMPDILGAVRTRFAGKRTLVVGAGHSAAGNLIALARLAEEEPGTSAVWAIRGNDLTKVFGGGQADRLAERGRLGQRLKELHAAGPLELVTNFRIRELRRQKQQIEIFGEPQGDSPASIAGIDEIISATGGRPDLHITGELRVKIDPWIESTELLAPLIDPNLHSCGTVRPHGHRELAHPEPGYYVIGAKSYGRAPNFLMATGYEQVRSVVAALAGKLAEADDVRLELPATGVCSLPFSKALTAGKASGGCCGGQPPAASGACCKLDAQGKANGNGGCGCKSVKKIAEAAACCA